MRRTPLLDLIEKEAKRKQKSRQQLLTDLLKENREYKKELVEDTTKRIKKRTKKLPSVKYMAGIDSKVDNTLQPFGWNAGTVRGMCTLWIVFTFCIISIYSFISGNLFIPVEWYCGIVALVIGAYYYNKFRMAELNGRKK